MSHLQFSHSNSYCVMFDQELPWTPGGIELLNKIKEVITENGGRKGMYSAVIAEMNQGKFWHGINRTDEVYRITAQHGIPYKQACNLIPMPYRQFIREMARYKRVNKIRK